MKRYEVIGNQRVRGYKRGDVFSAELDPEHERRLISAHHIRVVQPSPKKSSYKPAPRTSTTATPATVSGSETTEEK